MDVGCGAGCSVVSGPGQVRAEAGRILQLPQEGMNVLVAATLLQSYKSGPFD